MSKVPDQVTVLVYSNRPEVRAQIRTAVGRRPAPDTGRIDWIECSTNAQVVEQLDLRAASTSRSSTARRSPPAAWGLARQFKFEIDDCPPIVVLIARRQDGWLASWSLADAVINTPIEPVESAAVVADQLRRRHTGIPVVRG